MKKNLLSSGIVKPFGRVLWLKKMREKMHEIMCEEMHEKMREKMHERMPEEMAEKMFEKMREKMKKIILVMIAAMLVFSILPPVSAAAAGTLVVDDGADLLSDEEEAELIRRHSVITEYMDAAFVSTNHSDGSTSSYTEKYAIQHYGNDPAIIFMIDMEDREIYIYSNGKALKTISKADARAITDNIYKYASRGEYFDCADAAFSQIYTKCQGGRLARPVKHITNALIAVLLGVLLNYLLTVLTRIPRADRRTRGDVKVSVTREMASMPGIALAAPIVLSTIKRRKSKGSGGSGGGGGGHSGGGGGHGF